MRLLLQPAYIISILIAITVHEWAHAYTATRLGDPTPANQGRLTLNPIAHIDPLGALLFLTAGFGWAKPVPINPAYFSRPKRDTLLTAIAGPASNLVLAFVAYLGLFFLAGDAADGSVWGLLSAGGGGSIGSQFFHQLFAASLFVNLGLMAFNLIPIVPLDGSKVLEALLPPRLADRYDEMMRYGPYILLALLLAGPLLGFPILSIWITTIMEGVLFVFGTVFGAWG